MLIIYTWLWKTDNEKQKQDKFAYIFLKNQKHKKVAKNFNNIHEMGSLLLPGPHAR